MRRISVVVIVIILKLHMMLIVRRRVSGVCGTIRRLCTLIVGGVLRLSIIHRLGWIHLMLMVPLVVLRERLLNVRMGFLMILGLLTIITAIRSGMALIRG